MRLPEGVQVPRLDECAPILVWNASFWAASMYTSGYAAKADRLEISCEAWGVCCRTSLVPDGVLLNGEKEGSYKLRHRLIAMKPLFILSTYLASPLPLVLEQAAPEVLSMAVQAQRECRNIYFTPLVHSMYALHLRRWLRIFPREP